ncbi:MAG TPA: hypothetical protein VEY91_13860, partial [Candidatus Limnocylindria bacterium]|nr:hypothetical protein [Candidatus Limnocylindria bacterium]
MRKKFVTLLCLFGGAVALLTNPGPASAQLADDLFDVKPRMINKDLSGKSLARLRSSAPGDPDTIFIGHIATTGPRPLPYKGDAGGYGPFHIGSGPARFNGTLAGKDGAWTFDDFQPGETDSLQGWWPYRPNYPFLQLSSPDNARPWWALDYGNISNYVINQGAANKRTNGVTGGWHRDPGRNVPGPGSQPVGWDPAGETNSVGTSGGFSAWAGLRAHNDLTSRDEVSGPGGAGTGALGGTSNYYNETTIQFTGRQASTSTVFVNKRFPGYMQQWDQLLYRDVFVQNGVDLTVSFRYRTRMSTLNSTNVAAITGWYDRDPLARVNGNFISASAGFPACTTTTCHPVDSFMVYVGAPAEDGAGEYSDGSNITTIYDKQRRWFSEVLRVNEQDEALPYHEMLSRAGNNPADTADATPSFSATIPAAALTAIRGASSNRVRVVFRVKTNRNFDDFIGAAVNYTSLGRGAAVIDEVLLTGGFKDAGFTQAWAASDGDFEAPGSINNAVATAASAAWKGTGKPPGIYFHTELLDPLTYTDLCGDPGDARRQCDMVGRIVKDGDEDDGDAATGPFTVGDPQAEQERNHGIISPTVNLRSAGVGSYNSMGIDTEIAQVDGDINVRMDEFYGRGDLFTYGGLIQYGVQVYPVNNANGVPTWREPCFSGSGFFNPDPQCFGSSFGNANEGFYAQSLIKTSNANNIPDSIRAVVHRVSLCQQFGITTDCSAADGYYMDNVSLVFIDAPTPAISVDIWEWINDSFPRNETVNLTASPNFDTTSALVRSGLNIAQATGNTLAPNVPGDSTFVTSFIPNGRTDMIFRILPGPGNYVAKGNKLSGLRQVPTSPTIAVANAASSNFWESYLGNRGVFGTGGNGASGTRHPDLVSTPGVDDWDQNSWNSARMDTLESNIFPNFNRGIIAVSLTGGGWQTTYHDAEVQGGLRDNLGILKNRCFLQDTSGVTTDPNIDCDAAGGTYPPPWTAALPPTQSGYPGTPTTEEYTKIMPDGQFTPGTSVQYFFRASVIGDPITTFDASPDTNIIYPQLTESNFDGHRWQQFGVLPDNWKLIQPAGGQGVGRACMLYVDNNDSRGDERVWVSVADSSGLTSATHRGAHNGWSARGDFALFDGVTGAPTNVGGNNAVSVRDNKGQGGTIFDIYQVKASESLDTTGGGFGSRGANAIAARAGSGLLGDGAGNFRRYSVHGPTAEMLRAFYRMVVVHTGDLNAGMWGPYDNRSDDEWALINDFVTVGSPGTTQPRGVFVQGDGFAEAAFNEGFEPNLVSVFNVDLADPNFSNVSGVTLAYIDLITTATLNPGPNNIYGVFNGCIATDDVLDELT